MKQKIITPDIKICYCGSTATIRTWERGHAIIYRVECENNHKLSKYCGTSHKAICRWNNRLTALQNKEYNMTIQQMTLLSELLDYSNRYQLNIQFCPDQTAVYIEKDGVEIKDFGGSFEYAISQSLNYLKRINKEKI